MRACFLISFAVLMAPALAQDGHHAGPLPTASATSSPNPVARSTDGAPIRDPGPYRRRNANPAVDWLARGETPLIQAVLYRDVAGLEQALAAGAHINAPGKEMPSVLHADLVARAYEAEARGDVQPLMWHRLRQLGALPRPDDPRRPSLLYYALQHGLDEVAVDLMQTGGMGAKFEETLGRKTGRDAFRDRLLGAYLRGGHFEGADRLVRWLLEQGQHGWAYRILRVASNPEPLDHQPDPDHEARAAIVGQLIVEGKPATALRLFQRLPWAVVQGSSMEVLSINQALGQVCDARRADAFVDAGLVLGWMSTYMDCLSDTSQGPATRLRMLRDIDARGGILPEDWDWVFGWKQLQWLKRTGPYRRHLATDPNLQGYAGIVIRKKAGQFAIHDFTLDSPAREAGLRVGDGVTAVNGMNIGPLTPDQAAGLIRGAPGTAVELSLVRDGVHWSRTVVRRIVPLHQDPPAPASGSEDIEKQIWHLDDDLGAYPKRAALLAQYLEAGRFGQADSLVRSYLTRGESAQAMAVLRGSSERIPFDRQRTPANHYDRLDIAGRLVAIGQIDWAARMFADLPDEVKASPNHPGAIVRQFARTCDFPRADAFRALGLRLSWTSDFSDCLSGRRHPPAVRQAHLRAIIARGGMERESWDWLLRDADKAWLRTTPAYRMRNGGNEPSGR